MKTLIKDSFNPKSKNLLFFGFLIVYGIILVYLSYKINISEDEAYTLNTTSYDLSGVIRQSYHFEAQPPIYFILLSLWRNLYPGIFFAKLFSILFIGLSAYVFYRLVLLFSGVECSKWMVVIFLLNPFTVWAALEMRTYSLLIFLSTISIYFFFRYYFDEKKNSLYLFLIISAIGIYTQYFFIFLISTLGFIMLFHKGFRTFLRFCLYMVPVILLFLPNFHFLPNQIALQKSHGFQYFSLSKIFDICHTPQDLLLAIHLIPDVWINRTVRIVFIAPALYAYLKLYKKHQVQSNFYLGRFNIVLLSLFILLVLFCIGVVLTGISYEDKYMLVTFPFLMLLFSVFKVYSPALRKLIYGAIAIYFIILLSIQYTHPVKTYDFISIAKYVEKIELPNEPILIYRPAIALPFQYYYNGKNTITPIPHPVKFNSSYLINIKDTIELKQSIANIKSLSNSYLLLSDTTIYEGKLDMNRKMVTDYLNSRYNITLDTLYLGWSNDRPLRIRRLEKK